MQVQLPQSSFACCTSSAPDLCDHRQHLGHFVSVITTLAINKWRDLQRKSIQQQQDRLSDGVHKAVE
ncbi:hypothetical protein ACSBR2_028026 [Camellia fascicularis]